MRTQDYLSKLPKLYGSPPKRTWSARVPTNDCRLSKYHSQKPESTRRKIFNRDSTLQHFVQISSGSVISSVRTRAKTPGRTPVSIELPRGRHLGSKCLHLLGPDACIIGAPMPSSLHKSAQQEALDAYIFMCKSTIQRCARPRDTRVATTCTHPRDTRVAMTCTRLRDARVGLLARVQEPPASATSYARLPMARVEDARVGHVISASASLPQ